MECSLCHAETWLPIPEPLPHRSITTAGTLLNESLAKSQCGACALVQRAGPRLVGDSDFYEEQYATYYRRPGAEHYDAPRYAAMAELIYTEAGGRSPRSILDVGCGAGWSMLAMKSYFPGALIEGVEPSRANAERAQEAGFNVHIMKIGDGRALKRTYDLIYANNVLQHTLSPTDFLLALRDCLSERGLLALICPDATRPSNEILWCDHNFSFQPKHLLRLAEGAGLRMVAWRQNTNAVSLLDKQLVVLSTSGGPHAYVGKPDISEPSPEDLYRQRCRYINSWRELHVYLCDSVAGRSRVFNFGGSMWSRLLAAYCPDYWRSVAYCLVDQFAGTCLDKEVKPTASTTLERDDCVVLGVNPASHRALTSRFRTEPSKTITWDQYVDR